MSSLLLLFSGKPLVDPQLEPLIPLSGDLLEDCIPSLGVQDIEEVRLATQIDFGFVKAGDEFLLAVEPCIEIFLARGCHMLSLPQFASH